METNILIGCTGSVATIKLPILIRALLSNKINFNIRVVVTEHSRHFFAPEEIPDGVKIFVDQDEWMAWSGRGDPVLHIELGKWADLFVIAPLDANTLAKMSQGICDNLLTCTARAWDPKKPFLFCPAMNTRMWDHPITGTQVAMLKAWGYREVPCIAKTLMCGDKGLGAMAEVDTIVEHIEDLLLHSAAADASK